MFSRTNNPDWESPRHNLSGHWMASGVAQDTLRIDVIAVGLRGYSGLLNIIILIAGVPVESES